MYCDRLYNLDRYTNSPVQRRNLGVPDSRFVSAQRMLYIAVLPPPPEDATKVCSALAPTTALATWQY